MDEVMRVRQEVREREWMERIRDCRSSGKAVSAWCKENGISRKTYYYHLRMLRERICEEYLPVSAGKTKQTPVPVMQLTREESTAVMKVRSKGMEIEIGSGIPEELLLCVLRALQC